MSRCPLPATGLAGLGLGGDEALGALARAAVSAAFEALLEGGHEVNDLVVVRRFLRPHRLALALVLDQGAQGILIAVAKLAGIEVAGLLLDDLLGDLGIFGSGFGRSGSATSSTPRTSSRRVVSTSPPSSISMAQMRSRVLIARRPIATMFCLAMAARMTA
jgi:hypothetical protein